MTKMKKMLVGAATVAAMTVTAISPAQAQYRDRWDRNDGIGAGEIIAGAVVLGGLAAILSSSSRDRGYRYGDQRYSYDYNRNEGYRYGGSRQAVNQCVNAVERGDRGRVDVRQVRDIQRTRYGYRVTGSVSIDDDRGRYGRDRYDRYDRDDRRGRGGSFSCVVERGQVVDVDYGGRGWR